MDNNEQIRIKIIGHLGVSELDEAFRSTRNPGATPTSESVGGIKIVGNDYPGAYSAAVIYVSEFIPFYIVQTEALKIAKSCDIVSLVIHSDVSIEMRKSAEEFANSYKLPVLIDHSPLNVLKELVEIIEQHLAGGRTFKERVEKTA